MNIYIDFDGTIYNNNKLNKKYINIFQEYNIPNKYIEKLITETKNYNLVTEQLIKEYNLNNDIITKVNNIYLDNYIYKDVIPFLKKYYQKYNLILLTYTNDISYQQKKINSSNITKYFKNIIITTKDKSLLKNIDYTNSIFIDNNPIEIKKFYKANAFHTIRIKRNNDKYSKINLNINSISEFKNFKEILNNNYFENIQTIKKGDKNYE